MWINFLVCTLLGYLSGLGVGGGGLLMLWLTQWQALPYPTARTVNLLFFLPSSLIAPAATSKTTAFPCPGRSREAPPDVWQPFYFPCGGRIWKVHCWVRFSEVCS